MIIGATPESDRHILSLTQGLYGPLSAQAGLLLGLYARIQQPPPPRSSELSPAAAAGAPPLPGRLVLRFYHFRAEELLDEAHPNLDPRVDPKCTWALRHMDFFPVEVRTADYEALLRVPGIGVKSARRILTARRRAPSPLRV